MENPCPTCTKAENPMACTDKNCEAWQKWFLYRWAKIRAYALSKGWIERMRPSETNNH